MLIFAMLGKVNSALYARTCSNGRTTFLFYFSQFGIFDAVKNRKIEMQKEMLKRRNMFKSIWEQM